MDAAGDPLVNVASADHGTIAVALFSQETFDAALAIDGELQGARGWAYHGRLDMASIVFAFDRAHEVSRVRLVSGYGMPDHHITAFQLWAFYPPALMQQPPPEAGAASSASASILSSAIRQREEAECQAFRLRFEQLEQGFAPQSAELPFVAPGWALVRDVTSANSQLTAEQGVSGTIMVTGSQAAIADLILDIPRTRAMALKVVVRDADSPTSNAVLTEFQAFAEKSQDHRDGAESRPGAPSHGHVVVFEDTADAPISIRILSPENGASMRRAPLKVAISGAAFGPGGVVLVVSKVLGAKGRALMLLIELSGP